jgi:chromate transporter
MSGPKDTRMENSSDKAPCGSLRELAALMLRLGFTAFGGPAAHIAMLEDEVVRRRRWLSQERFLDLLGATNLIPGPNSTEMMIHIGMLRAGVPGLWVAGACFITPAVLITLAFAWAYVRYGALPAAQGLLFGLKPAVLAIIGAAIWKLGRTATRTAELALLGLFVFVLYLLGVSEVALLLASGALGILLARWRRARALGAAGLIGLLLPAGGAPAAAAGGAAAAPSAWVVGLYFLKIGSVLFGSGYVLLAFLQQGLVEHYGWLTRQQLLDAVAVGQFTPGPVFSTATFVGYVIAGVPGAVTATLGIFLPSFVFVWVSHPWVPKLRASSWASGFLDGVNVGSVALMAAVALQLGQSALRSWPAVAIALVALALLLRTRLNTAWIVLGSALVGAAFYAGMGG